MPYLNTPNGKIFFHVQGTGPPMVLLHGAWASHEWWKEQINDFSKEFKVYTPDLRGHGNSSDLEKATSVEDFSHDLHSLIISENIENPCLVGWSMGGFVAAQYCMDHPGEVKALILIASRAQKSPRMKVRVIYQYFRNLLNTLQVFSEPRNYEPRDHDARLKINPWLRMEAKKTLSGKASNELIDWVAWEMSKIPLGNYFQIGRSVWSWGPGAKISAIKAPTLIMVGDHDTVTSPVYSIFMAQHIKGATLKILEGEGHYVALENPSLVNAIIRSFLQDTNCS